MSIFNKLEVIRRGEFKLDGDITLPFLFHIKDIKDTSVNETKLSKEYKQLLEYKKLKNLLDDILNFIDLDLFLIDKSDITEITDVEFIQDDLVYDKYRVKDIYELNKLIAKLELTEIELYDLREYIVDEQNKLITEFLDILHKEMENGKNTEHLSEAFMSIQVCSEFGNGVIFKENMGKCMSEFSFREIETKRAYLSRKYEVEKIQYENLKKENK
ncbi:hypothetical protein FNU3_13 [Fusobacterium phage vB_FnuS_FNU3]|uniref:Uncharacterized protein n=1 Tax=Fusobacterium phage Fnu1 TaxID=2530024 RepID=A0A481W5H7_9CAUD|nr:hypothetical protein KMD24_gp026 [Fusobacterium phage Fnu1]QBJ04109.1 hypothetical protein [Fusobacterium phage Fnu1]WGH50237.1 hypothetical protein FNU2_136 [Fusobacterium phage vB_FnuS_FNU2]WGH50380.1 hypothetical protein FNU3_13 [Fusobacterium phage vB_FnuS_FNU3]